MTRLLLPMLAVAVGCSSPSRGLRAVRSPITIYEVTTARWDGADHLIALGESTSDPHGAVIEQTHQQIGHEQPKFPRVADIQASVTRGRVTLAYPSAPSCVGTAVSSLKWSIWAWRDAVEIGGCSATATFALAGEHPGLRLVDPVRTTNVTDDMRRIVGTGTVYQAFSHAGLALLTVGNTKQDANVSDLWVLSGDRIMLHEPQTRLAAVFDRGEDIILLLVGIGGSSLVTFEHAGNS